MYKEYLKISFNKVSLFILFLERKHLVGIYLCTLLFLSSVTLNFFLFPGYLKIEDQKSNLNNLAKRVDLTKARIVELKKLKKKEALLNRRLKKEKAILVKKAQVQNLVSHISLYGDKAGIDLMEYTPLPVKKRKTFIEIPLSLSIKGRFNDVFYFIKTLSAGKILIMVERINIKSTSDPENLFVSCIVKGFAIEGL